LQGLIPEPYAPLAQSIFSALGQGSGSVTTPADVADGVWRAVHDPSGQLRFPAGPDAVKLAQSR
jgi:hypothetical protein